MTFFWELQIFQPLFSCALSEKRTSYIWTKLCPVLHITISEQTRDLGVIGVIDHKNTIAILHALVKILGDFLRIRRITLHVHRYSLCVCSLKLSDTVLQSIFVVYTLLI